MTWMDRSPKGRTITTVEGDPQTIIGRGDEIEQLGEMMSNSATILRGLAEGTDGLQGKAAAKLREGVGDVHTTLAEAGRLYTPTGPVVRRYGVALSSVQPAIAGHVRQCESLWERYQSLPGSLEPRGTGGSSQPEEGSPEAQAQADEDAAKLAAYEEWKDEAWRFDADYDTWETAFDTAAAEVGSALAGKIEDSFWDDVDGVVAGFQTFLGWAGLVVGVLALIVGGPIVALIAGIISFTVLALTIYQKIRGDASWTQLGLAILAVVPFSKLGSIFQGKFSFADDMFGGLFGKTAWSNAASQGRELGFAYLFHGRGASGVLGGIRQFFTGNNPNGIGDIFVRALTGKDVKGFEKLSNGITSTASGLAAAWEVLHGTAGQVFKVDGWIAKVTGHETIKEKVPFFEILW